MDPSVEHIVQVNDNYDEWAPNDGTPWPADANCNGRVVRGGSREDSAIELRSAARTGGDKQHQFYSDGLRIGRPL
jgi:formylglycine-generating enzyme required for sulfatase activity